jgi:hypothetical protein
LEDYISDGNSTSLGFEGMLHLYSLWLGESKPFFRAADSTKMQNLYDYWDAMLTQAANLKVELLHQNGAQDNRGGQTQLTDFLGDPTLSPPTTGTFQANQAANLKLMFPPVPTGTVVSTQDHTMWGLLPWAVTDPYGPLPYSPAPVCQPFWAPWSGYPLPAYAGVTKWKYSPSLAQWQAAVALAPPLSSAPTGWLP